MTIKQQGGVFGRNPTFNDITVDGELAVPDDVRIKIGDGDDLVIYHNSSNNSSYIAETGSGNLLINGSSISFNNGAFTKTYMLATDGGSVQLRYNDDPKIETANTGVSITGNVIVNSGSGIDFSATAGTGTSELLDDYEEGTWTPTVRGTTAGTYTLADVSAYYTKIGNQVTITAYFGFSAASGGTSLMRIENIPFAYKGYSVFQGAVRHGNITLTTADADVTVGPRFFNLNTAFTDLFLFESTGGSASVGVQISGISTSSTVAFTATYTVE
jgi:hypothetical protein